MSKKKGGAKKDSLPLPGGRDRVDSADLLVDAHQADVGVGLDTAGAALPRPRGGPNDLGG